MVEHSVRGLMHDYVTHLIEEPKAHLTYASLDTPIDHRMKANGYERAWADLRIDSVFLVFRRKAR